MGGFAFVREFDGWREVFDLDADRITEADLAVSVIAFVITAEGLGECLLNARDIFIIGKQEGGVIDGEEDLHGRRGEG